MYQIFASAIGVAFGGSLGSRLTKKNWIGVAAGAASGYILAQELYRRNVPEVPIERPEELPAESTPTEGLGFIWIWAKDYYTIWAGHRYLPVRYTTRSAATDWLLDTKEKNWNQTTYLLKKVNGRWVRA